MKVKIKDLRPNPFRNMEEYFLDGEKVRQFVRSINETGFWDNILARNNVTEANPKGEFQIAYGHHRLCALTEIYGENSDEEIDIPVKELSDALMLKIMAEENNDEYGHDIKVIDQTIEAIGNWLALHPEESKGQLHKPKDGSDQTHLFVTKDGRVIGKRNIQKFLPKDNWSTWKITESLNRLESYKSGKLDKDAVHQLQTQNSAKTFSEIVEDNKLTEDEQREAIKRLREKKNKGGSGYSETEIRNAVFDTVEDRIRKGKIEQDKAVNSFIEFIKTLCKDVDKVSGGLGELIKRKEEFTKEAYMKEVKISEFMDALDFMVNKLKKVREAYGTNNTALKGDEKAG